MFNNNSEENIIIQSTNRKAKIKITIKAISIMLFSIRPLRSLRFHNEMSKKIITLSLPIKDYMDSQMIQILIFL
jgi:hypothetical protein